MGLFMHQGAYIQFARLFAWRRASLSAGIPQRKSALVSEKRVGLNSSTGAGVVVLNAVGPSVRNA